MREFIEELKVKEIYKACIYHSILIYRVRGFQGKGDDVVSQLTTVANMIYREDISNARART